MWLTVNVRSSIRSMTTCNLTFRLYIIYYLSRFLRFAIMWQRWHASLKKCTKRQNSAELKLNETKCMLPRDVRSYKRHLLPDTMSVSDCGRACLCLTVCLSVCLRLCLSVSPFRSESGPTVYGADPAYNASDGRARPGPAVWPALVGPGQRRDRMGWERSRSLVHIRTGDRHKVPSEARSRPYLSSPPSNAHSYVRGF